MRSHASFKFLFLFSASFQIILTIDILHCAIRKWKNASEVGHLRNNYDTWSGKAEDLNKLVDGKFYYLYNKYIEIGESILKLSVML